MMLEVRNLKRVYKVKGGSSVYALNDVSLKFPETGLVFILGKSGSGKSTLLNVMGGLDNVDDGEIIINGKSSKSFSKGEMDSYRNTYLGFIFQEYNILNDFSVKENIALALELQHKKATDEIIDSILKEVDLVGYGKRKPNELSGGQKQRVAIARALVKDPKIIFGDEPTGALDSNTGKQVFETLKNLSKTRLVVIVSHDRDFAEHFGDRVIELKDGKVISDISKTSMKSETANDGLTLVGDNIIRLNKDRPLKPEDLPIINKAISSSGSEVYIVADSYVNGALCEAAKIDKDGNREEFVDTDPDKVPEGSGEFEPIKSKFSLGHAFRMGSKSLRVKPFRLVMTILLSTVAFSLFGASFTLSLFNAKSAMKSTIQKDNISVLDVTARDKNYSSGLSDERIKELEDATGVKVFYSEQARAELPLAGRSSSNNDLFHATRTSSKMVLSESDLSALGFKLHDGKMPSNERECAISLYLYWSYADLGYANGSSVIEPSKVTPSAIIGTELNYYDYVANEQVTYKITGIIDTNFPERLASYRTKIDQISYGTADGNELYSLSNGYNANIHTAMFIDGSGKKAVSEDVEINSCSLRTNDDKNGPYYLAYYPSRSEANFFFETGKSSLGKGEALITLSAAFNIVSQDEKSGSSALTKGSLAYAINQINTNYDSFKMNYISEHYDGLYEEFKDNETFQQILSNYSYDGATSEEKKEARIRALSEFLSYFDEGKGTDSAKEMAASWLAEEKKYLGEVTELSPIAPIKGTLPTGTETTDQEPLENWSFSIVGIDLSENSSKMGPNILSVSKEDMDTIRTKLKANGYADSSDSSKDRVGYVSYGGQERTLDKFLDFYFAKSKVFEDAGYDYSSLPDDAWVLKMNNATLNSVEMYANMIVILTQVFLYVGIAMAIFSMLLFYNFISVSINNKKREIGILRAVGAKRSDVFKIFYSEAFIIAIINFLLSSIAVFVISYMVNGAVQKNASLPFNLMNPNILVLGVLLAAALASSIISAFLPVTKIANKKPIDAIQNR